MEFELSYKWNGKVSISGPRWDMRDKLVNWLEKEQWVIII